MRRPPGTGTGNRAPGRLLGAAWCQRHHPPPTSLDIGLEIQPCGLAAFSVGGPVKPPYHTVGFRQFLPFFSEELRSQHRRPHFPIKMVQLPLFLLRDSFRSFNSERVSGRIPSSPPLPEPLSIGSALPFRSQELQSAGFVPPS